ncbi:MAG: HAD hydrolase-like protein [Acidimicrobiales bacterium]
MAFAPTALSTGCAISSIESVDSSPPDLDQLPVVLFDLDGTLTDPKVGIVTCLENGMRAVGLNPSDHGDLSRFIGPPLDDTFAGFGLNDSDVQLAIGAYRERFATHGIFENEVYDGTVEMLQQLRSDGWTLGVATSKPEPFAVRILAHFKLDQWFGFVAAATLDGTRRTKADVIAHALQLSGRRPGDHAVAKSVVMIGDRQHDIAGARSHQIRTIAVSWGYGGLDELVAADPWRIAGSPGEIPDLLREA